MFSTTVKALIKAAEAKGVKFKWATKAQLKGAMGVYNKRQKTVYVQRGMSLFDTEETIAHEIAHALWDLSLKGKKVKRADLKRFKVATKLPVWLNLIINYQWDAGVWKEERFAFHMESRPGLLLHLFNQL